MNIIKQKGSSTVEFAMILPILLLLIFMVSELGTMFYQLNTLTKSVQIAARYLSDVSVNPKIALTNAEVKHLICYGDISGTTGAQIVSDCNNKLVVSATAASDHVTVSANYPADWILPNAVIGFLNLSGQPMTLSASSVMRFAQ